MKLLSNVFLLATLVGCSSIPRGKSVMKKSIDIDKKEIVLKRESVKKEEISRNGDRVQVIRSYAHVIKDNILSVEGVYLVPYPRKGVNWEERNDFK